MVVVVNKFPYTRKMMKSVQSSTIVDNISLEIGAGVYIFKNLSLSLNGEKSGLVGKNGSGKTTLLRLLVGELEPTEGKIDRRVDIAYLPQDYQLDLAKTISEILELEHSNDYGIEDRALKHFDKLNFKNVDFSRRLKTLSGGERMKVVLVKLLISKPGFLIMDEPTNNLDQDSRGSVYDLIRNWDKGLLVVSHDRELLGLVDQILELTPKGLNIYGGNYNIYKAQKELEEEAQEKHLVAAKEDFNKTKKQAQKTKEKQEKRSAVGKKFRDTGSQPKIILNTMRSWSEKTTARLKKLHQARVEDAEEKFRKAKENIAPKNKINVDLSGTAVPAGKLVFDMKNINFSYSESNKLFQDLNLTVHGPARIAIKGPNGSGKTTLVRLMLGELKTSSGETSLGIERSAYLDQNTDILNNEETLVQNVKRISGLEDDLARVWLARFLFRGDTAFKKARVLSGGERMRAALACILAGENPPQLLILDEPTNNLDFDSIERIESALLNFRGALIVISHDQHFLGNIGVDKEIKLPQTRGKPHICYTG